MRLTGQLMIHNLSSKSWQTGGQVSFKEEFNSQAKLTSKCLQKSVLLIQVRWFLHLPNLYNLHLVELMGSLALHLNCQRIQIWIIKFQLRCLTLQHKPWAAKVVFHPLKVQEFKFHQAPPLKMEQLHRFRAITVLVHEACHHLCSQQIFLKGKKKSRSLLRKCHHRVIGDLWYPIK